MYGTTAIVLAAALLAAVPSTGATSAATTSAGAPSAGPTSAGTVPSASAPATLAVLVAGPLTLTPSTAPANVSVGVTGRSRLPLASCILIFDTAATGKCRVNDAGAVSGSFVVPLGAQRSPDHKVYACLGSCTQRAAGATLLLPLAWLDAPLVVPDWTVDPLRGPFRAGGKAALVTGSGFSPGGSCDIKAGSVHARSCSVSPLGRLSGLLPVTAGTPTGSYAVTVTNLVGTITQAGAATLDVVRQVAGPPPTSAPAPPTSPAAGTSAAATSASRSPTGQASSSSPGSDHGHGKIPWRTIAIWGGGIGGGLLLVAGAVFSALRWRDRPRTLPAVRVTLIPRAWSTPRLVGVHRSHLHAVHLRMRAAGGTSSQRPRRKE